MALFGKESDKNSRQQFSDRVETEAASSGRPTGVESENRPVTLRTAAISGGPNMEGRAFLDKGCRVNGKISFEGPARIDGYVEGEISGNDLIIVGETAVLNAQLKAESIIIAGKVSGDIFAGQRLEIRPSARVVGNLTTPVLVIQEGALFKGHCSMQVEGVKEERKVAVLPKDERTAVSQPKPA